MQKRIFINYVGLILFCVVFLALSFGFLFFRSTQAHEMTAIRDKANLVADLLNQNITASHEAIDSGGTRITVITPDGWVLSDSHAGADLSINRSDRAEFVQAISYGSGEAIRRSDTLGAETFYYALRLNDGNVLRLSRTLHSLGMVFMSTIPALIIITIIVLVIAHLIAHRLTRSIIKPLTKIDFDNLEDISDPNSSESLYEELWPYMRKIDNQKHEIASQLTTLKSRTETIEAIIANMREGIVMLDEKGLVLAINQSVLSIFDIPKKSDILQKSIGHIYRDPEFTQAVKSCLDGAHLEINFERSNRFFNTFLSPASGGAIIFFLDITEQHKADQQRKEFTANVSHELKTPLTTISALSEMMANSMVQPDDAVNSANKIYGHSKRLINIIDDIIRLSEFDESKTPKDFVEFNIFELAETVIASLQDKAHKKSVMVELTGQPLQIKANSRLIDDLLFNLIDNGIKYNKEGGQLIVEVVNEADFCKLSVSDTGIGIPSEQQKRVFERFYRVDTSRTRKTGGTGLGLSIVKHIVEHHNGKLTMESTEGEGTTITCYLPSADKTALNVHA